jgi:hypothetical protein
LAFKESMKQRGETPGFQYILGTDNEAYAIGEALKLASGRLTKASGTDVPLFICQKNQAAEATAVTPIPVIPVTTDQEYETTVAALATSVVVGDRVTIHTDGLQVTATETNGVFRITYMAGTASGSVVRGIFDPALALAGHTHD